MAWSKPASWNPNLLLPCFEAATSARLKLTKRYCAFPSDKDLEQPDVVRLRLLLDMFLHSVPKRHQKSWQKMLTAAYPELKNDTLQNIILKLVVRS